MIEPRPEYAERLKRERIREDFLDDIQRVLNKWEAEMTGDDAHHICFTIHSPLRGVYDPEKPMVDFSEWSLWAGERELAERPGEPINWDHQTLEAFVDSNYWHNAEDAIGDIRRYIANHKHRRANNGGQQ